jgi:hypothetical protein
MNTLIVWGMAVLISGPVAAQTYKWVDERGTTSYGEKPPEGRPAKPVDTRPSGTIESSHLPHKGVATGGQPDQPRPLAAAVSGANPVRGMDFDTFIRLQRGMTEGELILRSGRPDHETVENFRHDIVKSYYYYPTVANPFITTVTLRGGRIADIERVRKSF